MSERPRDEIWDALVGLYGEPTNQGARGRRNKAVKMLKESGATPVEIEERYKAGKAEGLHRSDTDVAFANNWDILGRPRTDEVEAAFKALWPGKPFSSGWEVILAGFTPEEIIETLERASYSSPFPPGAGEVRRKLIHQRLGDKAPLEPKEALLRARQRQAETAAGLISDEGLDEFITKAWQQMKLLSHSFDDSVFLTEYQKLLEDFYFSYGRS